HSIPIHTLATRGLLGALAGLGAAFALLLSARAAWRAGERSRALVPPIVGALVATLVAGLLNPVGLAAAALTATLAGSLAALGAPRAGAGEAVTAVARPAARAARRPARGTARPAWPLAALLALGML